MKNIDFVYLNYGKELWFDLSNLHGEIWKDIPEFVGKYQISSFGRVKSLERINPKRKTLVKARILKPMINSDNYLYIKPWVDGKGKNFRIHQLVARNYIPNPQNLPEINHKNRIRWDNRVENLEWVTQSENQLHSFQNGRVHHHMIGENNHKTPLIEKDVIEIKRLLETSDLTQKEIGKKFNVWQTTIGNIKRGVTWKHVQV